MYLSLTCISSFIIYLIFYPRLPLPDKPPERHSLSKSDLALAPERRELKAWIPYPRLPRIIGSVSLLLVLLILVPPLAIVFFPAITSSAHESLIQVWSFFTGILSLLTATLQSLPQIHTTLQLKHHHSLSMITLAVQIPVSVRRMERWRG